MSERDHGIYQDPNVGEHSESLLTHEVDNFVATIGNHEGKLLTLGLMKASVIYTQNMLHSSVVEAQGENKEWIMDERLPYGYCRDSLSRLGMVAREIIDANLNTYGYMKTPRGIAEGDALAGELLSFSQRHSEYSLLHILGSTASPVPESQTASVSKKRAPLLRLRIIRAILANPLPMAKAELAREIGVTDPNFLSGHLKELSENNVIQYKTPEADAKTAFYQLVQSIPDTPPSQYSKYKTASDIVYAYTLRNTDQWHTATEITNNLAQEYAEMGEELPRSVVSRISHILAHFAGQNYLTVRDFTKATRSDISLTEEQRDMLADLTQTIDGFKSLDPSTLTASREKLRKILTDHDRVSKLFKKVKEASRKTRVLDAGEYAWRLLGIVRTNPGQTTKAYQALAQDVFKINVSRFETERLLHYLEKGNNVRVAQKRQAMYWEPIKEKESLVRPTVE